MNEVVERFLRYVKIDTQSQRGSTEIPTTAKQFDLARVLVDELNAMGMQDVTLDEKCFVMATLPANISSPALVLGFLAHLDTSPDFSGTNVHPQIFIQYDGGDIALNAEKGIVLSPRDFPELKKYRGQTLITTDGLTLLGADDKAGVAEIMAAMNYLIQHPEIPHGKIRVAFTPDEEVGTGIQQIDLEKFGVDFAYTLDGGELGELQYENFNAAEATVTIHGRSVHPGSAKNKMINAVLIGIEFNQMLPVNQVPQFTDKYEGFYHLDMFQGGVEETVLRYIVREHDRSRFEAQKVLMQKAVDLLNLRYGDGTVELSLRDQYYNMRELIEPVMHVIDLARESMLALGITPVIEPIRGGTDGAQLTYRGTPTPNLFTGGHNYHGKYEYAVAEDMQKAVGVIIEIAQRAARR